MKKDNCEIDNLDLEISSCFMKNAALPYTEVAKQLIVSGGTIHVRMKKLYDAGIIKGSQLVLDYSKLGYDIGAFVGIYLEKGSMYKYVAKELAKIPEIVEINYTTGAYSMFVKLVSKNTHNLREVLNEKIQSIKGIERTETFIALEQSLSRQPELKPTKKKK